MSKLRASFKLDKCAFPACRHPFRLYSRSSRNPSQVVGPPGFTTSWSDFFLAQEGRRDIQTDSASNCSPPSSNPSGPATFSCGHAAAKLPA